MKLYFAIGITLAIGASGPLHGQQAVVDAYDLRAPVAAFRLPAGLREASGLAVTRDGRLYAHGDERAELFELSPATGEVLRRFTVGDPVLLGDFEGLAIVGARWFLTTSTGTLVEFGEGGTRYALRETGLDGCEVEGLAHDPRTNALLIACKQSDRGAVVVHAYDLRANRLESVPRVAIDRRVLRAAGGRQLQPSGIVRLPDGGFLIVAARQNTLLELAADGSIRALRELAAQRHPQAEGIALLSNGSLAIVDEGGQGRGTLTIYGRRR